MRVGLGLLAGWLLVAGAAHAQSPSPQTAHSPWSLHDALDAPEELKLSATMRVRLDIIDGQSRPGFNPDDRVVSLRTSVFAELHGVGADRRRV